MYLVRSQRWAQMELVASQHLVEVGLVGTTMHAVDERAPLSEIRALEAAYGRLIDRYFEAFSG